MKKGTQTKKGAGVTDLRSEQKTEGLESSRKTRETSDELRVVCVQGPASPTCSGLQ